MLPVSIASTGIYLPSIVQSSQDMDAAYNWPLGQAEKLSGVMSRRCAALDESSSMMAAAAIRAAAGDRLTALDRLLVTYVVPEQPLPTTAALTAKQLGLNHGITAYDLNASCLGFLQAVESAATAIAAGLSEYVAVAAVEKAVIGLDENDTATASLFGDGAAAAILEPAQNNSGILSIRLETFPEGSELCEIRAGGTRWNIRNPPPSKRDYFFRMNGNTLARMAMGRLPTFIDETLERAGVRLADIACIMPHQASRLGLKFLERWLGKQSSAMIDIFAHHGNQVTVSLPTVLHHAISEGRIQRGDLGMMVGTAAGFGMGVMIFRY